MKKSNQQSLAVTRPTSYVGFIFVVALVGISIFAWRLLTPDLPPIGGMTGKDINPNTSSSADNLSMAGMDSGQSLAKLEGDLHALTVGEDGRLFYGQHAGVQISQDGGQTWTTPSGGGDAMGMGVNAGQVFLAGHDFFAVSPDSGRTWRKPGVGNLPGTDIHGFSVAANGWLYANLAGGGLYRSTDNGLNWNFVTQATTRAYKIVASTGTPPVLYALTQDQGLIRSSNGGTAWKQIKLDGQPLTIAVETSGAVLISQLDSSILRSSDGGVTWAKSKAPEVFILLAIDPKNSQKIYGVSEKGQVYASRDAGRTWSGR